MSQYNKMLVKERKVRRIKGGGLMDFFGSAANKVGSFFKSPTFQSIKTNISDFANTDVGKAVVSAGKDIAIAGATGIKDKIVEKIANSTATKDKEQASKELSEYLARSLAANQPRKSQEISNVLSNELANLGLLEDQQQQQREPVQVRGEVLKPGESSGAGVNVKKVNALLKKVSGRGLSKLN